MKIRKVRVTGSRARCLPDDATDFTHEVNLTNAKYPKAVHDNYFKVVDGEPVEKTQDDLDAEVAAALVQAEEDRKKGLRDACFAYQYDPFDCDYNFYGLLIGARVADKAGPKTLACLAALDVLWTLYYTFKADSSLAADFSAAGIIPHSYSEVRAELEANEG